MSDTTTGIAGKVVAITGASSGLGEATARHPVDIDEILFRPTRQER